jgi:HEAT repeat protein
MPKHERFDLRDQLMKLGRGLGDDEYKDEFNERISKLNKRQLTVELKHFLDDSEIAVKWKAADLLLKIDEGEFIVDVLKLLKDDDPLVRGAIGALVGNIAKPIVVSHLTTMLLGDPDENNRYIACDSLEQIGDLSIVPVLKLVASTDKGADFEGRLIADRALEAIKYIESKRD